MEMWLLSAILALIAVAGVTPEPQKEISLDHKNKTETVSPGSSLIFRCCLKVTEAERCRVSWLFEPSGKNKGEQVCNDTTNISCNACGHIQCKLPVFNETNNGLYYCKFTLEIPTLSVIESNKTQVIVKNVKENTTVQSQTAKTPVVHTDENWWMWALVGSSCLILIILLVIFLVQKRPCNRSQVEEPIYINTNTHMMPKDNLKAANCSKDIQTPSSVRRYEGRNQRYKH